MEFSKTIRGVEVIIHADKFDGDPSTGIELGPEELWAETDDGKELELTDSEYEECCQQATESYLSGIADFEYGEHV